MLRVVSCQGYAIDKSAVADPGAELQRHRRALTLRPYVPPAVSKGAFGNAAAAAGAPVPFFHETPTTLFVPRLYGEDNVAPAAEWTDAHCVQRWDPARVGAFSGQLRTLADGVSQQKACDAVLASLRDRGGAILSLYTGAGKTTCALYVAWRLGVKTAVVVHKDPLLEQWRDRCRAFLPGARVGLLRGEVTEVDPDAEITLCMLQSLLSPTRNHRGLEAFGLVILDEVHHLAAKVFSQIFRKLTRPYMLGLSATVQRKDRMDRCLGWFVGPVAFRAEMQAPQVVVQVRQHTTRVRPTLNKRQQLNFSKLVTDLTEEAARNAFLQQILHGCLSSKRSVLVLSDRRAHCVHLRETCARALPTIESVLLIGGDSKKRRKRGEPEPEAEAEARSTKHALYFGTYSLVAEGVDIPHLNTLVMATPRADVRQAVGRILRGGGGGGRRPLVVDVVDSVGPLQAQFRTRKRFYTQSDFKLHHHHHHQPEEEPEDTDEAKPVLAFI